MRKNSDKTNENLAQEYRLTYIKIGLNIALLFLYCFIFGMIVLGIPTLCYEMTPVEDDDMLLCICGVIGLLLLILITYLIFFKFKSKLFFKIPQANKIDIHYMSLQKKYFSKVKAGGKTIELRLADNKRRKIKIGDLVVFSSNEDCSKSLTVKVTNLYYALTFAELAQNIVVYKTGFNNATQLIETMASIYNQEKMLKYGVVGIEFKKLNETIIRE